MSRSTDQDRRRLGSSRITDSVDPLLIRRPDPVRQVDHAGVVGDLEPAVQVEDHAVDLAAQRARPGKRPRPRFPRASSGCESPAGKSGRPNFAWINRSFGVSTQPGAIMLHVIDSFRYSTATCCVSPHRPGLAHDVGKEPRHRPRRARRADVHDRPSPLRARTAVAALIPSHGPFKLIESVCSQSASLVDSTVPRGLMPAQLTSRSSPPHFELTRPIALAQSRSLPTSRCCATTSNPRAYQLGRRLLEQLVLDIGQHDPVRSFRAATARSPARSPGRHRSPGRSNVPQDAIRVPFRRSQATVSRIF